MTEINNPAELLSAAWGHLDSAEQSTDGAAGRDHMISAIRNIVRAMAKNHGLTIPDPHSGTPVATAEVDPAHAYDTGTRGYK